MRPGASQEAKNLKMCHSGPALVGVGVGITHREGVKECASWRKEVRREKKRGMERGGDGISFLPGFVQ